MYCYREHSHLYFFFCLPFFTNTRCTHTQFLVIRDPIIACSVFIHFVEQRERKKNLSMKSRKRRKKKLAHFHFSGFNGTKMVAFFHFYYDCYHLECVAIVVCRCYSNEIYLNQRARAIIKSTVKGQVDAKENITTGATKKIVEFIWKRE